MNNGGKGRHSLRTCVVGVWFARCGVDAVVAVTIALATKKLQMVSLGPAELVCLAAW